MGKMQLLWHDIQRITNDNIHRYNMHYNMTKRKEPIEDVIEVVSCWFALDWATDERHKINLKEIWGIELHWRADHWCVVVITKEKDLNLKNVTYELSHWVSVPEIKKLLNNPKVMIKNIVNFHSSTNFIEELQKVMSK